MSSIIERLSFPNDVLALICSHLANYQAEDEDEFAYIYDGDNRRYGYDPQIIACNGDYYAIASRFSVRSAAWGPPNDVSV